MKSQLSLLFLIINELKQSEHLPSHDQGTKNLLGLHPSLRHVHDAGDVPRSSKLAVGP